MSLLTEILKWLLSFTLSFKKYTKFGTIPKLIIETSWKDNVMVLSGSILNIKNKTNGEEIAIGNSWQENDSPYNISFYFF